MFDGFQKQTDEQARKRLFASTGVSVLLCVIAGAALIFLASRPKPKPKPKPIEVSFKKLPKPKVAPKPKPKPKAEAPKPKPKKKAASKKKRSNKKVAKSAPSVPTNIPDEALAEGDASDFVAEEEIPDSVGVGGGGEVLAKAEPKPAPEPIVEEAVKGPRGPIIMPEKATPPKPRNTNRAPSYPEKARKKGLEGTVILKVVITQEGDVENIKVLRGEEPFIAAALDVVRGWRYAPAVVDGEEQSVYRIIKVPFRLRRG